MPFFLSLLLQTTPAPPLPKGTGTPPAPQDEAAAVLAAGLEGASVLREALGSLVPAYLKLKHVEWNDYARHLTQWERDTTLDC